MLAGKAFLFLNSYPIIKSRSKSQAVEKARKESITDGLKRAMKSFGNLLGNCLNDKEYIKYLTKTAKKLPENIACSSIADSNMSNLPNSSRTMRNGTSSDEGLATHRSGFPADPGSSARNGVTSK
jgi:recombination DNA repair RAD52 pathway protein